ncbi:SCO3374 family protein [Streptomyces sp. NPDC017095]|uniref:SCO3374 family protein n=1 Tax=unclassified Streptomyces TaxID=2593676 RepID=UPI003789E92C
MAGSVPLTSALPLPRRPPGPGAPAAGALPAGPEARARHWYENELGWPTVPGRPLRLLTGVRFDALDVPAEAGAHALRHLAPDSPVLLRGDRMALLVAPGSAEELPGLLDWLEWGPVPLDLRVLGPGGTLRAPVPAGPGRPAFAREAAGSAQGAAVWLRPPGPGPGAGTSLPAMPGVPGGAPGALGVAAGSAAGNAGAGSAPDLVRLVDTVAAHCHRVRLRRVRAGCPAGRRDQPLAFS